ncbi:hypothetical protein EDB92DRAFT_1878444 [Lactarius akahatsu]|uniref:Uncharacterized protein n=1 Tax=Lactarius akahatsu TaxID=416441 RepID=A0AAD4LFM4_9AGAM|nr:hypothetical protein EDB92DRAFT_1878444 [Lactarius akahatsu]
MGTEGKSKVLSPTPTVTGTRMLVALAVINIGTTCNASISLKPYTITLARYSIRLFNGAGGPSPNVLRRSATTTTSHSRYRRYCTRRLCRRLSPLLQLCPTCRHVQSTLDRVEMDEGRTKDKLVQMNRQRPRGTPCKLPVDVLGRFCSVATTTI